LKRYFSAVISFFGVVDGPQVRDLRLRGRGKHGGDSGPGFSRGLLIEDMHEDIRGDRVVEPPLYELIPRQLGCIVRVRHSDLLSRVIRGLQCLGRCGIRAVEEAKGKTTPQG
jgi:hypothetical protein